MQVKPRPPVRMNSDEVTRIMTNSSLINNELEIIKNGCKEGKVFEYKFWKDKSWWQEDLFKLIGEAQKMIALEHYRSAVIRSLNEVISNIELYNAKTMLNESDQMHIVELYRCRIWCLLKACEHPTISRENELKNVKQVLNDCVFLLRTGYFHSVLEGTQISKDLAQLEAFATHSLQSVIDLSFENLARTSRRMRNTTQQRNRSNGEQHNGGKLFFVIEKVSYFISKILKYRNF
jgi:hypothetical protein